MKLYHYAPKQNTVEQQGILSTAKAPHGWQKYLQRAKAKNRQQVMEYLKGLDSNRPYAVSMFRDPISDDAPDQMKAFRDAKQLYQVDLDKLKSLHLIASIVAATNGPHNVKWPMTRHTDWKNAHRGKFLFSEVPHYLVSVKDGVIPVQAVKKVQKER